MKSTPPKSHRFQWIGRIRVKFFFKPLAIATAQVLGLMLMVPDLPVIGPAVAPRAHAQIVVAPPCNPNLSQMQIIQTLCSYINPPFSQTLFIPETPPTAALQQFESDSVQEFLTLHGLPSTDSSVIYQYGRADLRSMVRGHMLARLLHMANFGPSTPNEQNVYNWFQYQVWQFQLAVYQVAVADKNSWESNPCGWMPDADIASAYGLVYDGSGFCNTNSLETLTNLSPDVPSAAYFLAAALKKVCGTSLTQQTNGSGIQAGAVLSIGEEAGIAVAGGAVAGVGAGLTVISAASSIFVWSAAIDAVGIGPLGGALGVLAGPGVVVFIFVALVVLASFETYKAQQILNELANLDNSLSAFQSAAPALAAYVGFPSPAPGVPGIVNPNDMYKFTAAFTATTLPEMASTPPLPAHNPATDVNFYLTPSGANTPTLNYTDGEGRTWSAQTFGGWFVQQCTSNCQGAVDSITPTLEVVDSSGVIWYASRSGASFSLTQRNPRVGLLPCPANQGAPSNPAECSSYFTRTVPYKDANGDAGDFSLVTAAAITSAANAYFSQGVAGSFTITARGLPAPAISATTPLPTGFSLSASAGTAQLSYNGTASLPAGSYSVGLSAQNGTSVQQTLTIAVNAATPLFTSPATAQFVKGVPGTFTIQATGNPSPAITSGSPHFPPIDLSLVDNGNGTATISGTIPLNASYCNGSTCNLSGLVNATIGGVSAQQDLTVQVTSAVLPLLLPTNLAFITGIYNQGQIVASGSTLGAISNVCNPLPSWLTFTDNGNNTATLSGTPPIGASSVGLDVIVSPPGVPADVLCTGGGSNYTLGVLYTPVITSQNQATFTAGTAGSFTATGNVFYPLSATGFLPQGLSFNSDFGQGVLTGTPAAGTGGVYPLQLTLSNPPAIATQNFTLVVDEQPGLPGPFSANFTVNQQNSFPLNITGYPHTPIGGQQGMQVTVESGFFGPLPPGVNLVQSVNAEGQGNGEWLLSGTPAQTGSYTFEVIANNGLNGAHGHPYTINVVPVPITQTAPAITWPQPAAVTFGSALSSTQLNATANVPGTFLYTPPAGTVLPVGLDALSVSFTPSDTTHYANATATNNITVNAAPLPASGVNLVVTQSLSRSNGNVSVLIHIANTGGTAASDVTVTSVKVGADAATPLPQDIGTLGAGSSNQLTVTVPGSVGATGAASSLMISGTYGGGKFTSSARITLP